MCIVFLYFSILWKPLQIPFERYRYEEKRWRIGRDMAFRSSDDLVILLRKLPERCKARPSKLCRNLEFCPIVSQICTQVYAYYMYPKQKIWSVLSIICGRYARYGTISLPNVTTNQYIFFQIFCRQYLGLSDTHTVSPSLYTHTTCIISVLV